MQTAVTLSNTSTFQHFVWARHDLYHSGALAGLGLAQSCEEFPGSSIQIRCYSFHLMSADSHLEGCCWTLPLEDPTPLKDLSCWIQCQGGYWLLRALINPQMDSDLKATLESGKNFEK